MSDEAQRARGKRKTRPGPNGSLRWSPAGRRDRRKLLWPAPRRPWPGRCWRPAAGLPAGGGSSTADDVLNIGLPVTPKDFGQTTKYLAAFTKKTGITVKPFTTNTATNTWVAVFQEVSTRLAGGEAIDSAYIATEGMQLFEKRGVLEPLNSYIATDQPEVNSFYADVSPNMLANFRQLDNLKGHTYFIPIGYNVMSMWYNRKLFKSARHRRARARLDLGRLREGGRQVRRSASGRLGFAIGAPVPGPFTDVYPWVLTNGGGILNADQTKCTADTPANIEAAAFVRSLVTKKLVNQPGGSYNAFNEAAVGKLGMFGAGIWPNTQHPAEPGSDQRHVLHRAVAQADGQRHPGRRGRLPDVQADPQQEGPLGVHQVHDLRGVPARPGGQLRR